MTKSAKNKRTSGRRPAKPKAATGKAAKARGSTRRPSQSSKSALIQTAGSAKADHSSKQAQVIGMLRLPAGASISAMMNATGWQQHSVRGFLAGVVRKKLRLNLTSEKLDGGQRIYRIIEGGNSRPALRRRGRQSA